MSIRNRILRSISELFLKRKFFYIFTLDKPTIMIVQIVISGTFCLYLVSVLFFSAFSYYIITLPLLLGITSSFVMSTVGVATVFSNPWKSSIGCASIYVLWALFAMTTGIGMFSSLFWLAVSFVIYVAGVAGGYFGLYCISWRDCH